MSRVGAPRNRTKARVTIEIRDGRAVAIKDFSAAPWWYRALYARPSLRRELRAYARLQGVEGIPRCFGFEGADRLLIEKVEGRSLDRCRPGDLSESALAAIDRLVDSIHRRGVAIADLHRSNILVDDNGRVSMIDFALARVAADPARPGWMVRTLQRLDKHAAARIRAQFSGQPEPQLAGWFGFVYRCGKRLKEIIPR